MIGKILLLIILLVPVAYAENRTISTDIVISLDTFINADSSARANLTISTENEGTPEYSAMNITQISGENFTIKFSRDLFFNETFIDTYLNECEGDLCREQWHKCIEAKKFVEGAKQQCDAQVVNISSYLDLYVQEKDKTAFLEKRVENISGDMEYFKADSQKTDTGFFWGAGLVALAWVIFGRKDEKTKEEKETGVLERAGSKLRDMYYGKKEGEII
mgnify:CR=1 FL=1